jgi:hypothetical protein
MLDVPPSASERFRATLDLFETGLGVMRQNLRRAHPEATDAEVDRRLRQWLQQRPGARWGDCVGRPLDVSRRFG